MSSTKATTSSHLKEMFFDVGDIAYMLDEAVYYANRPVPYVVKIISRVEVAVFILQNKILSNLTASDDMFDQANRIQGHLLLAWEELKNDQVNNASPAITNALKESVNLLNKFEQALVDVTQSAE